MATTTQKQPADPWSTGIMAGASVAGAALNDKTNQTQNNTYSAMFDNSGWSLNIGAGASQSTSAMKTTSTAGLGGLGGLLGNPLVLLALAGAAYYVLKRK